MSSSDVLEQGRMLPFSNMEIGIARHEDKRDEKQIVTTLSEESYLH